MKQSLLIAQITTKNHLISFEKIKKYIEKENLNIKNTFIILRTGWSLKWGTPEYHNNHICPHILEAEEAGQYFVEQEIAGLGIDTLSPDKISFDGEGYFPIHEILLSKDIFIIENIANLDKINQNECMCIIAPLRII